MADYVLCNFQHYLCPTVILSNWSIFLLHQSTTVGVCVALKSDSDLSILQAFITFSSCGLKSDSFPSFPSNSLSASSIMSHFTLEIKNNIYLYHICDPSAAIPVCSCRTCHPQSFTKTHHVSRDGKDYAETTNVVKVNEFLG